MVNTLQKRNYALDIARIVGIFAVILIHCSFPLLENAPLFSAAFVTGNLCDGLARVGVPLFLMVSGALFLDETKEVTLKGILQKNVKSLAIVTLVWAVVYAGCFHVLFPLVGGGEIRLRNAVSGVVFGHYHMWYLYMILGLYIITPFLRAFVRRENKGLVLVFIGLSLLTQFAKPLLGVMARWGLGGDVIASWIDSFCLDFFSGYVAYYLAGWYIVHVGFPAKCVRYALYAAGALSLVGMVLYVQFTGDYETMYCNVNLPVFLYAASVFAALTAAERCESETAARWVTGVSKLTFGVYIVHIFVLTAVEAVLPHLHPIAYVAASFVLTACGSFALAFVISKIPLLKKLIKA